MAQNITVGYEGLQQSATALDKGKEDLGVILRDLQAVINNLTAAGFRTRVASNKFSQCYREWTDGTTRTVSALNEISRAIQDAQQKHQQADATLAEGASNLGGTGGGGAAR